MSVQNFQGALRTYLLSDAALSALVSDRIYSFTAPQNTIKPYVIIQYISRNTIDNLVDFSGRVIDRWQIDAYAETADEVQSVANAIFEKLHLKHHETWSGYKVDSVKFDNDNSFPEPVDNGSEKVYHRIQQDFFIKHQFKI